MSAPLIAKLTTKELADYVILGLIDNGLLPEGAQNYRVDWLIVHDPAGNQIGFKGVEIEAEMGP